MNIYVRPDGTCQAVYDEAIDLAELGDTTIRRASHVEPVPLGWTAYIWSPAKVRLGPFNKRSEAIRAEIEHIETQLEATKAAGGKR